MTGDEDLRHNRVSEKLSQDLDKLLMGYRSFDGKPITEGEVMTAIGRIIARKSTTENRVMEWVANIGIAAQAVHRQLKGGADGQ